MKKINNKGFVLVETLVVSIFVLFVFVMVYRNGVPMIEEYKKLENYDDLDTVYAANILKDVLRQDDNFDGIIQKLDELKREYDKNKDNIIYIDLTDCDAMDYVKKCPLSNGTLWETTKLRAGITDEDKIVLTYADPSFFKDNIDKGKYKTNRAFSSYVGYLKNTYINNPDTINKYMLIITRTENSKIQVVEGNVYVPKEENSNSENIEDNKQEEKNKVNYGTKDEKVVKYASITLGDRKD